MVVALDSRKRQVLIKLKALSVSVPGDELYFGIGEPLGGQECEHLMSQQVRMNAPVDAGQVGIPANDLLDPPGRKWLVQSRLKQKVVAFIGIHISLQGQPEVRRKENIPVLAPFAVVYKDLAAIEVHVADPNVDQLAYPDGRVKHQLEHQFVLGITALLHSLEELLELSQRQQLRQSPLFLGLFHL